MAGLLSKERITAQPGFNRWLVPPAALAIHLSIGMAYGFSVFWLPLSRAIGIAQPAPGDWKISTLGWMYTLFFVFLGSSAALFGRWLERDGPRKAGVVAACCWGGGFLISAVGVYTHQIWLLWLGSGVIGGCGLGLGYISPVSTLIQWFPDRRGMATGLAIMGFGGGATIGAPLADALMKFYATPSSVGVWETFLTMGLIYLVAMLCGAFGYRLPPPGWVPQGRKAPSQQSDMITKRQVHVSQAWKTPQFWLLWWMLCLNVSAGIGVIGMAAPMIQEVFKGTVSSSAAAGFAGLLSLFNIGGRIFWSSLSDFLGRQRTYSIFFAVGILLYSAAPSAGKTGSVVLFVAIFCVILTMYGGAFATIPAYLSDLFGTRFVAATHGRLLTAWSTAGVLGPVLVNYIREYQIGRGIPRAHAYNTTMYILSGLLLIGFFCNMAVKPVAEGYYTTGEQLEAERRLELEAKKQNSLNQTKPSPRSWVLAMLAWLSVGAPLLWGIYKTLKLAWQIF